LKGRGLKLLFASFAEVLGELRGQKLLTEGGEESPAKFRVAAQSSNTA